MHTYIQPNPLFGSHYFHNYARKAFSFKLKQKQTTKFLNEKNVGGQTKKKEKKTGKCCENGSGKCQPNYKNSATK